jgi:catechol O-methyltransferase
MSWMMNLGPEKRRILEKVTAEHRVRKVLEIGTYCGYSALALAHSPLQPDAKIVSLEINKRHAEIAKRILAHSGVRNVNVVTETIYEAVSLLNDSGPFDLVLMDQEKEQYLDDLRFLEERNLIRTGGLVVADNVIFPGAPDYVAFMR